MKFENENGKLKFSLDEISFQPFELTDEMKESAIISEGLSEDNAKEMVTLFEAAVNSKANEYRDQMEEAFNEQMIECVEAIDAELSESIQGYLSNIVVEEWLSENKVAVETNIEHAHNQKIVEALVNVLKENLIDVEADTADQLNQLTEQNEKLHDEVSSLENQLLEAKGLNNYHQCLKIFDTLAADLTESQKEKFEKLVEDLDVGNVEKFEEKASLIKKTFFEEKSDSDEDEDKGESEKPDSKDSKEKDSGDDKPVKESRDVLSRAAQLL